MEHSPHEKIKKLVSKYAKKWKTLLWLGHWNININYTETPSPPNPINLCSTVAKVDIVWEYKTATLTVYLHTIETIYDKKDWDYNIERAIIHELSHIIVNEMRWTPPCPSENNVKHEERVVTHLSSVFWDMYLQSKKKGGE
jgi:hypothetical protein